MRWRNLGRGEKQEFVCLQASYHGETIIAPAVTDVAIFRDAYGPLLRYRISIGGLSDLIRL